MKFPDLQFLQGFNAPGRFEADIHYVPVIQGEIPSDLQGAFYRVGPDPQFPPKLGTDIPFNGDGMISMFRFEDGHVDFRSRYVRTPKFVAEREAGQSLFGAYRNPFTDDPSVAGVSRSTANTNVLWHGGRMYALKEDSHPIEINPVTLETLGPYDFGGELDSPTATAHPKVDPTSGAMVFFGYEARGDATPDIAYYETDADGNIMFSRWLKAPYSCMVHDFAVTENHIVFPLFPLTSDLQWLQAGEPHFKWDPSKPMYLGVVSRRDPVSPIRWYQGETCFASHTMNAYEIDGKLHVDMPVGKTNVFPFFPEVNGNAHDFSGATPFVSRWTIDLDAPHDDFSQQQLSEIAGEFPRIDERFATVPYRYGFVCMSQPDPGVPGGYTGLKFNLLGRIDHMTGETATHYVGDGAATQEPVFVPRPGSTEEGDGYLMALINRYEEMRSDLLILDATRIDDEPVATIGLPLRLRNGLHGTWIGADDLSAYVPSRPAV